jgi:hypothetical protein
MSTNTSDLDLTLVFSDPPKLKSVVLLGELEKYLKANVKEVQSSKVISGNVSFPYVLSSYFCDF